MRASTAPAATSWPRSTGISATRPSTRAAMSRRVASTSPCTSNGSPRTRYEIDRLATAATTRPTMMDGMRVEAGACFLGACFATCFGVSLESDSIFMPMTSGSCQAAGKDANASKEHPGPRAGDCFLKVFRQTTAAIEPSKGSFDHPALWLNFKCTDTFRSCNDLDKPLAELCECLG